MANSCVGAPHPHAVEQSRLVLVLLPDDFEELDFVNEHCVGRYKGRKSVRSVRKGGWDGELADAAQRKMRKSGLPSMHDLLLA